MPQNIFDQFDEPTSDSGNIFDQFDQADTQPASPVINTAPAGSGANPAEIGAYEPTLLDRALEIVSPPNKDAASVEQTARKIAQEEGITISEARNKAGDRLRLPDLAPEGEGLIQSVMSGFERGNYAGEQARQKSIQKGEDYNVAFSERFGKAIPIGWDNMTDSLDIGRLTLGGSDTGNIANVMAQSMQRNKANQVNKTPGERQIEGALGSVNEARGVGQWVGGATNAIADFFSNPEDAAVVSAEQAANSVPSIGLGAAGAVVGGAAAGIPGAAVGGKTGLALGSASVEFGAEIQEMVSKELGQAEPTPENIKKVLDRPGFMEQAKARGLKKGLTVAAIDTIFVGVSGKIATAPYKSAAKAGVKPTLSQKASAGVKAQLADMSGESIGEAASQQVARGEVDSSDVLLEGLASAGPAVVDVTAGGMIEAAKLGRDKKPSYGNINLDIDTGVAPGPAPDFYADEHGNVMNDPSMKPGPVPELAAPDPYDANAMADKIKSVVFGPGGPGAGSPPGIIASQMTAPLPDPQDVKNWVEPERAQPAPEPQQPLESDFYVNSAGQTMDDLSKNPGRALAVPSAVTSGLDIEVAAHEASTSPKNDLSQPSDAQKEAGNYKKGHTRIQGLDVAIENPAGSKRNPKWPTMKSHYGYIKRTVGADSEPGAAKHQIEQVDAFIKQGQDIQADNPVFIVDQYINGKFDEHKVMMGYASEEEARQAYNENYTKGWKGLKHITQATPEEFKAWLNSGATDKEYSPNARPLENIKARRGKAVNVTTTAGTSVPANYAVIDIDQAVASNNEAGNRNERYPEALQPRDRTRGASQQQVAQIANNLNPELLGESTKAGDGAPVIGPDGVVESGNGRVLALMKAYTSTNGEAYREYISKNAEKFGLNAGDFKDIKRPVLVRMRSGDMSTADRAEFARQANQADIAPMSPSEQAKADASRITDEDMAQYAPSDNGNVLATSNNAFLAGFAKRIGTLEAGGLSTSDGRWTKQMADRVQAAVFFKAYGDERLLGLVSEEADPEIKNILNALNMAAPAFARARSHGPLGDLDAVSDIVGATDIVREARAGNTSIAQIINQTDMFGETDPVIAKLAEFMDINIRSARRMGFGFIEMANFIEHEMANANQDSLFETAPVTKFDVIAAANKRLKEVYGDEIQVTDLFSQEQNEPTDSQRPAEPGGRGREQAQGAGTETEAAGEKQLTVAPTEDLNTEPPAIGQPFLVYRVGSKGDGLDGRNAGNSFGIAQHIARQQDWETPDNMNFGDTVSFYEVTLTEAPGEYQEMSRGQTERGEKTDSVGRRAKDDSGSNDANVWYSFPAGKGFTYRLLGDISLDEAMAELEQRTGHKTIDSSGTYKGGLVLQELAKQVITGQTVESTASRKYDEKYNKGKSASRGTADKQEEKQPVSDRIITDEALKKARELINSKRSQLNSGIDPDLFEAYVTVGAYHVESGARKFSAFAKAMLDEFGEAIAPYLKTIYSGIRDFSGVKNKGMSTAAEITDDVTQSAMLYWKASQPKPKVQPPEGPEYSVVVKTDSNGEKSAIVEIDRTKIDATAPNFSYPELKPVLKDGDPRLVETQQRYMKKGGYPGQYESTRSELHERLLNEGIGSAIPVVGKRPVAILMGGGGAAGKGTVIGHLGLTERFSGDGYVHVDPDEIKKSLPEYKEISDLGDYRSAAIVHEESSDIGKELIKRATADGQLRNILIDKTLSNKDAGIDLIKGLQKLGYDVTVVGVTIDPDEALIRSLERYFSTARLPVPEALIQAHAGFNNAYEDYSAQADEAMLFDNMKMPELISYSAAGIMDIKNVALYNRIVERGNLDGTEKTIEEVRARTNSDRSGEIQAVDNRQASEGSTGKQGSGTNTDRERVDNELPDNTAATNPRPEPQGSEQDGAVGRNGAGDVGIPGAGDRGQGTGSPRGKAGKQGRASGSNNSGARNGSKDGTGNRSQPDNGRADLPVFSQSNYRITEADQIGKGTALEKARSNIAAIRIAQQLKTERRQATKAEQAELVKYTGWGDTAIKNKLFPAKGEPTGTWKQLHDELRSLLTDEELKTASRSVQYAHYTSKTIIDGIYKAVQRFGLKSGVAIEGGSGTGHFLGLMPENMNVHYTGIEMDILSGAIGKALYPESGMITGDFTRIGLPENHYDLSIGNPPFASIVIKSDPKYRDKGFMLHDYFIAKQIDSVKPGGIAVFVTSKGTMNKVDDAARAYLAERANLIGAVRLPQTAFKENAGTEVVTDVLFFQKKGENIPDNGVSWTNVLPVTIDGSSVNNNEYFVSHPEMVLGKEALTGSMYRTDEYTVEPTGDLAEQLDAAVSSLPKGIYKDTLSSEELESKVNQFDIAPEDKEASYYVDKNDILRQVNDGVGEVVPVRGGTQRSGSSKAQAQILRDYIVLRDAVMRTYSAMSIDSGVEAAQKVMSKAYSEFVAKHGPINQVKVQNRKDGKVVSLEPIISTIGNDPEAYRVAGIEIYDEATNRGTKGDIFTKNIISRFKAPSIESAIDALNVTLNDRGYVDIDYLLEKYPGERADVIAELGTAIFKDPDSGRYLTEDAYLSGNVKDKLYQAEQAAEEDSAYNKNVEALKAVQPEDMELSRIQANIGAQWIDDSIILRFAQELMGFNGTIKSVISGDTSRWIVTGTAKSNDYSTARRKAVDMLSAALNSSTVSVYDYYVVDGKRKQELNVSETAAANQKVQEIKDKFKSWVKQDADAAEFVYRVYNERFNTDVPRKFNGDHLQLPGLAQRFQPKVIDGVKKGGLHLWVRNSIWRILQAGNMYMAHTVGAGKTLASIGAGMELRRLGLAKKPTYAVLKSTLKQYATEFYEAYPNAKILIADETQLDKKNRRRFMARMANEEWDAIIMTHQAFQNIQLSPDFVNEMVEKDLTEYRNLLEEVDEEDRGTRSQIERMIESMENKLVDQSSQDSKDEGLTFEELGIDFLFIDEAHTHKKIPFPTAQSNIKGVDSQGSAIAYDLYLKTRYLNTQRPNRNLVLMSGTPVTNTLGEVFNIQRYLQPQVLESKQISSFDAWAATFADAVTDIEMQPNGRYKPVTRMSRFTGVAGLLRDFLQIADVVSDKDLRQSTSIKRPTVVGGQREIKVVPRSPEMKEYQKTLDARIKALEKKKGPPKKGDDNILVVITDGKKSSIDMRLVGLTQSTKSKLDQMIDDVYDFWLNTKDKEYFSGGKKELKTGSTQLIFTEIRKAAGFDIYDHIKNTLIERGVPEHEIAFIQDFDNSNKKKKLFRDMNTGKKRILIGGSKNLGTGTNVQQRLGRINHLDIDWVPANIVQREGRGIRQGNKNNEIEVVAYATEGTVDSTMWQMNERKQGMIDQVMSGDLSIDDVEDISNEVSQMAMAKALSSGNPLLLEQAGLQADVAKLQSISDAHVNKMLNVRRDLARQNELLDLAQKSLPEVIGYSERYKPTAGDAFTMDIEGTTYTERKEAGEALIKLADAEHPALKAAGRQKRVGSVAGFDLYLSGYWGSPTFVLENNKDGVRGALGESIANTRTHLDGEGNAVGTVRKIENSAKSLGNAHIQAKASIETAKAKITGLQNELEQKFQYGDDLKKKTARLAEINKQLEADEDTDTVEEEPAFYRAPGSREFNQWFSGSKVVDSRGQPIIVNHSTTEDFSEFNDSGDIGFHFGSETQAKNRAIDKALEKLPVWSWLMPEERMQKGVVQIWDDDYFIASAATNDPKALNDMYQARRDYVMDAYKNQVDAEYPNGLPKPRMVKAYLSIKNPITLKKDLGTWSNFDVMKKDLADMGIIDKAEINNSDINKEQVIKWIKDAGYDGVIYENEAEGAGKSYVALGNEQIQPADSTSGPTAGTGTKAGMPVAEAQRVADSLKNTTTAQINVVDTETSLPKEIRDRARIEGATGQVQAVHWKNNIYIVADRMVDRRAVESAILHEGQHYAGDQVFGKGKRAAYTSLWFNLGGVSGLKKLARDIGVNMDSYFKTADSLLKSGDMNSAQRAAYLVDEFLAHVQGNKAYESLPAKVLRAIKEFIGKIRSLLRKHGFADLAEANDADIYNLLKTMNESVRKNKKAGPLNSVPAFMTLFHASPHKFDRFGMEYIGTGEGAQAYGHGLYFAESEGVAGTYYDQFSGMNTIQDVISFAQDVPEGMRGNDVAKFLNDKYKDVPGADIRPQEISMVIQSLENKEFVNLLKKLKKFPKEDEWGPDAWWSVYNKLHEVAVTAHLYEVDIPDEHVKNFLDWDAPLSEQPESVQKALQKKLKGPRVGEMSREELIGQLQYMDSNGIWTDADNIAEFGKPATRQELLESAENLELQSYLDDLIGNDKNATGQSFYKQLTAKYGGGNAWSNDAQRKASEYLNSLGIKGIKYFDEGSRNVSDMYHVQGGNQPRAFNDKQSALDHINENGGTLSETGRTRNLVVFDDSIIKILSRNGEPVSAAEAKQAIADMAREQAAPQKQTDTPEFKAWFGSSKVVDENGMPERAHHLTNADFTQFDHGEQKTAKWKQRGYTTAYGKDFVFPDRGFFFFVGDSPPDAVKPNMVDMPVYLSIKNPLDLTKRISPDDTSKIITLLQSRLNRKGSLGESGYSVRGKVIGGLRNARKNGITPQQLWDLIGENTYTQRGMLWNDILEATGSDGLIFDGNSSGTALLEPRRGSADGKTYRIAVALDPTQIKSAIGNRGTFDASNPDIRFSRAKEPVGDSLGMPEETYTDRFVRLFQNSFNRVKALQGAIEQRGGTVRPESDVYLAEELSSGKITSRLVDLEDKHLRPLMDEMKTVGVELETLDRFLVARHAQERNAYIASINKDMRDGGSGMTNAEASAILAEFDDQGMTEALSGLAERVYAVNNRTLDDLVAGGHIKAEVVDAWRQRWNYYVPLKGKAGEEGRPVLGKGYSVSGSGIKDAMGRGAGNMAESPTAHTFAQAESTIVRTEKTKIGRALVELMRDNPDPGFWTMSKRTFKRFTDLYGEFIEGYDEAPDGLIEGLDFHRVKAISEKERKAAEAEGRAPVPQVVYKIDPRYRQRDDVFAVMIEGEEFLINIKDKIVAEQLKRMNVNEMSALVRYAGQVNRYLAMINTALNPEFVITNLERDFQTAMVNLSGEQSLKLAAKVAKNMPSAVRGIWQSTFRTRSASPWRAEYDELRREGGTIGFFGLEDIETKVRNIQSKLSSSRTVLGRTKKGITSVRDVVLDANLSVENAARLSAYVVARDQWIADGMSPREARMKAASLAKNLTVNFNRKGELAPVLNSAYLFYNASIQGSARIFTALKSPRVRKIVASIPAVAFGLAMYNRGAGGDDDDGIPYWDKISDYTKQTNLIIMYPDGSGEYFKIKLPYGYNVFWYTGTAMHDLAFDPRKTVTGTGMNMLSAAMNAFNPISGADLVDTVTPTIGKPYFQSERNINFMGAPIVPESPFDPYDRPDSQKYFKSTNPELVDFMIAINEITGGDDTHPGLVDVSPETVKHYVGWLTGGAGMFGTRTLGTVTNLIQGNEIEQKNVPLLRTLGGKPGSHFDTERYYAAMKEVAAVKAQAEIYKGTDRYKEYRAEHMPVLRLAFDVTSTKRKISKLQERRVRAFEDDDKDLAAELTEEIRQNMMRFSMLYDDAIDAQE